MMLDSDPMKDYLKHCEELKEKEHQKFLDDEESFHSCDKDPEENTELSPSGYFLFKTFGGM